MPAKQKTTQNQLEIVLQHQYVMRRVDQLIPYARNARTHSKEQIAQLAGIIKTFKRFTDPVLIDEHDGIIAGHGRVMALEVLGIEEAPCLIIEGLSDNEKRALMLSDNRVQEKGGWDNEMLKLELSDLQEAGQPIELIGWDAAQLTDLGVTPLMSLETLASADLTPEEIPAKPENPITCVGDVWLLGPHRVMCGDSASATDMQSLMGADKAHLIFTDPPYGVGFEQGKYCPTAGKKFRGKTIANDQHRDGDLRTFIRDVFSTALPFVQDNAVVYAWAAALLEGARLLEGLLDAGIHVQSKIIWAKNTFVLGMADYHWQHEQAFYGYIGKNHQWFGERNKGTVWNVNKLSAMEFHPTQKPVELAEIGITHSTKPGDLVLDMFGGSGMTLIASHKLERQARIMEIDPGYVDVMIRRWEALSDEQAIHEGNGRSFQSLKDQQK